MIKHDLCVRATKPGQFHPVLRVPQSRRLDEVGQEKYWVGIHSGLGDVSAVLRAALALREQKSSRRCAFQSSAFSYNQLGGRARESAAQS